ncbi:MAG: DUF1559 domain-containing protein, partial [Opitutaceae bacterium]|nr:DUF1559 domain-containing protein [Opitutaceae bacterium]
IIGILAAIIIPTVGKVRQAAQNATCISNLRQIGLAAQAYAADHRDASPGQNWFYPYQGAAVAGRGTLAPYLDTPANWNDYTKSVLTCPVLQSRFPSSRNGQCTYTSNGYVASIGENGGALGPTTDAGFPRTLRLSDSAAPARQVFFFDGLAQNENASTHQYSYIAFLVHPNNWIQYQRFPHNDAANAVFADGHCAKVPKAESLAWTATDVFYTGR